MSPGPEGDGTPPPLRSTHFGPLALPSGAELQGGALRYTLQGRPARDGSNLVLAFPSLTGLPDPRRWWPGLCGRGRLFDRERWAILTPVLPVRGPGPTSPHPHVRGPNARTGHRAAPASAARPGVSLSTRDQAFLVELLLDRLGIERVRLALGGSLGGMVALEWAARLPGRTDAVVCFAAPARQTALGLALNHVQREAIRLLGFRRGLEFARKSAMISYRTGHELEDRFGRDRREDGLPQVASYLDHLGAKLARNVSGERYLELLGAMDLHDVGIGRQGGVGAALGRFHGRLVGVGIPGDRLYPADTVEAWVNEARRTRRLESALSPPIEYRTLDSIHGHDGFLLEESQVGAILADALCPEPVAVAGRRAP